MTTYLVSSGVTNNITVSNGDTMSVFGSGTSLDITVNQGGHEFIYAGGVSEYTSLTKSGVEIIYSGGVASDTLFGKGGRGSLNISAGGSAVGCEISHDGSINVNSGGTAYGTTISNGEETVLLGGFGSGCLISGLGYQEVDGLAINTELFGPFESSDVKQFVDGGVASGTVVNAFCEQRVYSANSRVGMAFNTVVSGGGEQTLSSGSVSREALLHGGGVELVSAQAIAIGTNILASAYEIVSSGGTTSNTKVNGGLLVISSGGSATGHITFAAKGGNLQIDTTTMPTAKISGFQHGDEITLAAIPFNSANTVSVTAANTVTISAGGATYNLAIAGAAIGETNFKLVSATAGTILEEARPKMQFLHPRPTTPATPFLTPTPTQNLATSAATPHHTTTTGLIRETTTKPDYATPLILSATHT